jgi:hypothetical protein
MQPALTQPRPDTELVCRSALQFFVMLFALRPVFPDHQNWIVCAWHVRQISVMSDEPRECRHDAKSSGMWSLTVVGALALYLLSPPFLCRAAWTIYGHEAERAWVPGVATQFFTLAYWVQKNTPLGVPLEHYNDWCIKKFDMNVVVFYAAENRLRKS